MNYPVKYDAATVQQAIDRIYAQLPPITDNTIFLVLMNGGIWFSHELIHRYGNTPLRVYYAKVSSYKGKEQGTLDITYLPELRYAGKDFIVLDDICDTGNTINSIYTYLQEKGVNSVRFVTLIDREGYQLQEGVELISGIHDASGDFFVGCGLDDNDLARNLPYIGIC